jgi:hypothetical protein
MELFSLTSLIIFLLVMVVIFFAFREVNCWYWKINKLIDLQKEINSLLQKLDRHMGFQSDVDRQTSDNTIRKSSDYEKWKESHPTKTINDYYNEMRKKD